MIEISQLQFSLLTLSIWILQLTTSSRTPTSRKPLPAKLNLGRLPLRNWNWRLIHQNANTKFYILFFRRTNLTQIQTFPQIPILEHPSKTTLTENKFTTRPQSLTYHLTNPNLFLHSLSANTYNNSFAGIWVWVSTWNKNKRTVGIFWLQNFCARMEIFYFFETCSIL